jgi:hypothetical protein
MMQWVHRFVVVGARFWLAPVAFAAAIASAGIVAGYASTGPVTAAVPPVEVAPVLDQPPIRRPIQAAPRVNAAEGTVVRLGRATETGRVLIVEDRAGRLFQVLVTPDTVVKRAGRVVRPGQIRVGDQIVGVGARQPNGQFRAVGVRILPPVNEATP